MLFYHQISIKQEGLLIKKKEVNYAVLSSYINLTRGFTHKKRSFMLFYHQISIKQEGLLIKRGQFCCFNIIYQLNKRVHS